MASSGMKYALRLAYDGGAFSGWQAQGHSLGVQQVVEDALGALHGGVPIAVSAAGRTDAGVHARRQVVSFHTPRSWEPEMLRRAMDARMPQTVRALGVSPVPPDFDARHSARWREYVYFLWAAPGTYPHLHAMTWWIHRPWHREDVRRACALLPGTHDFSAFCRAADRPERTLRTIFSARLSCRGPLWWFRIRGNAFLTNMVRILVGSLAEVGWGRRSVAWFASLLEGDSRSMAGMTAPPQGLFLWNVGYGEEGKKLLWGKAESSIVCSGPPEPPEAGVPEHRGGCGSATEHDEAQFLDEGTQRG